MSFSIGAPEGWRQEDRKVQVFEKLDFHGRKMKDAWMVAVVCRGEHAVLCEDTENGWVCHPSCTVEDMQSLGHPKIIVDELVRVDEVVSRRRRKIWHFTVPTLTVEWSATRVSVRYTFNNGRRHMSDKGTYSYDTMYKGSCWTKRRARIDLRRAIEEDTV